MGFRRMSVRTHTLLIAMALAACESEPPPAPSAAPQAAAKKQETTDLPAEAGPQYEYAYSPVGKRDPFRSILDELAARPADSGGQGIDCGPLCKWELEQLRLVAVITGVSNPVGMVEDPSGKGYVVRRGSFMGKRNGKVTQIRAGEIVVTEIYKDQMGKPHVNPVYIRLPADKADNQDDTNLLGPEVAE